MLLWKILRCVIAYNFMTFKEYQEQAQTTATYPDKGNNFVYPTLGLAGEAGEVADKIKKVIRDNGGVVSEERKLDLIKELGDVLWYLSQLSWELGFSLEDLATANLNKLSDRHKRGVIGGSGDNR